VTTSAPSSRPSATARSGGSSAAAGGPSLVVRRAFPQEAADVAWLAAATFPLACPPGTERLEMARHVARKLTPAQFRAWATSADHALLVAVAPGDAGPGVVGPDDRARAAGDRLLGYALVQVGTPDGQQEAAVLREATGGRGPYAELSKIYAHPEAQGTGSSSALMAGAVRAAEELAAARGHDRLPLWLGTNGENRRAQAFYRKHGFEVVGTRTYDVGGVLHDDVVMLRRA
jgi:ribosomal protein S18 acetylase RimI-like enzyme